jgi:hypothetical protein
VGGRAVIRIDQGLGFPWALFFFFLAKHQESQAYQPDDDLSVFNQKSFIDWI